MQKATVLSLLEAAEGQYVSGEAMSKTLGVTRAAVWKQIKRLREKGYEIQAVTNLGYRLMGKPEPLEVERILAALGDHPWRQQLQVLDSVDSTNNLLKTMGAAGAPHGTVVIADEQTGGRGRLGRSFSSPKGVGIYFSLLLRPDCAPTQVGHVTAMVAVAVCDAIETVTGVRPGIKWTNDLILNGKKLAGILTEMNVEWESGTLQYLVTGIGINCNHQRMDFPPEVQEMATSLRQALGVTVDRSRLAAELVRALDHMSRDIVFGKEKWLQRYRQDCITIGKQVQVVRGPDIRTGVATGIDENGGLIVHYDSGETGVVYSGEVSVRGMYGYV
jgi:BirA family biotin operon repressor/biotin-[acetyl-CoA-carboxylase] ligase